MKNRLLGLPQKRILHKFAISSLNLPPRGNSFSRTSNKETDLFTSNRKNNKIESEKLKVEQPVLEPVNGTSFLTSKDSFNVICSNCNKLEL